MFSRLLLSSSFIRSSFSRSSPLSLSSLSSSPSPSSLLLFHRYFSSSPFPTAGHPIRCRAAIAWKAGEPLSIETIEVLPPKKNEIRLKMIATGVCHTDAYTLSGSDPEGIFPVILGHEGGAIVESIGEDVRSVQPGDHVIPLYIPECGECKFCRSGKTNLCVKIRSTQGQGVMPDGSKRFFALGNNNNNNNGEKIPLYHYMGCSTFSEYSVVADISVAKVSKSAPLEKVCLLGCGITTGIGAVTNTAKVEKGSSVAVWGLGGVGLSVIQGAKIAGASKIIAIDTNSDKFSLAKKLGATLCINPTTDLKANETIVQKIQSLTEGWGADYTFEAIGNVNTMREALESACRGWGQSCIIGVAGAGQQISTRPFQLVTGRRWMGSAFGGVKGRSELPKMVDDYMAGKIIIDDYITHLFKLDDINKAFKLMKEGKSIRSVILFDK